MSVAATVEHRQRQARDLTRPGLIAALPAAAAIFAGLLVAQPSFLRLAFAGSLAVLVIGFGLRAPKGVLYGLILWLAALGLTRRLLSSGFAVAGAADPLLLVGPLGLGLLLATAADFGAFLRRTRLSKAMLVLVALICIGAVNPLQGSYVAGLTALIFYVPLAAFWIGRGFDRKTLHHALLAVAFCAIPAALYGIYQIAAGFPSWDAAWIARSGYGALQVGSVVRPFSTFSSGSEYATFLSVATLVWIMLGRRALRIVGAAAVVLLSVAVLLQSSRGSIVFTLAALALMLAARRGASLGSAAVLVVAVLALLPFTVRHLTPSSFGNSPSSALIAHDVQGLANPFDPKLSTAGVHLTLVLDGLEQGIKNPLGHGISAVTIAGSKFGGIVAGTEADPSNAAVALGLPGLLAYLVVLCLGFSRTYRLAVRTRDPLAVVAVGVLTLMFGQWLNGGQYAVAFIPWLLLGWADRAYDELRQRDAREDEPEDVPTVRKPAAAVLRPRPKLAAVRRPMRVVEPAPAGISGPVVPLPRPDGHWRLRDLAGLAQRGHPARLEERMFLVAALRPYADDAGRLPLVLNGLVDEEFASELRGGAG